MSEKPKIYQNKEYKEFHNNKEVYMSSDRSNNNNDDNDILKNSNDIRKKINDILNSSSFIYLTKVNIVMGNDIITRKIVGIHNNNLITIDNEYIPIDNIKDIYK